MSVRCYCVFKIDKRLNEMLAPCVLDEEMYGDAVSDHIDLRGDDGHAVVGLTDEAKLSKKEFRDLKREKQKQALKEQKEQKFGLKESLRDSDSDNDDMTGNVGTNSKDVEMAAERKARKEKRKEKKQKSQSQHLAAPGGEHTRAASSSVHSMRKSAQTNKSNGGGVELQQFQQQQQQQQQRPPPPPEQQFSQRDINSIARIQAQYRGKQVRQAVQRGIFLVECFFLCLSLSFFLDCFSSLPNKQCVLNTYLLVF